MKTCSCSGTGRTFKVKPAKSGYVTIIRACRCPAGDKLLQAEKEKWGLQ